MKLDLYQEHLQNSQLQLEIKKTLQYLKNGQYKLMQQAVQAL